MRQTPLRKFASRSARQTGQIQRDDSLGAWLRAIALDPDVLCFLEIGAWEGNGSTRILRQAAVHRRSLRVVSLEANASRAKRAARRNASSPFVQVIWGSLVNEGHLETENLTEAEKSWLAEDVTALGDCPLVLDRIPAALDAVFLDGGEFSTRAEFSILGGRITKWLVLDDTSTRKARAIAEEIRSGSSWFECVVDSDERNGFMVAKKKQAPTRQRVGGAH